MTQGAGVGLAGVDFATTTPTSILPRSQFVPYFDLKTRTFPRDEVTGKMKLVHWVDQAVSLALGVAQGSLKSQPGLGHTLRKIKRAAGLSLKASVEDGVRVALQALVERKDIGVTSIQVSTPIRGQILVAVYYINFHTQRPKDLPKDIQFAL